MKSNLNIWFFIFTLSLVLSTSCGSIIQPPIVITTDVSEICQNSAVFGGNVTDDGGAEITERGVCWDSILNSTIIKNKISIGKGIGKYAHLIKDLKSNLTYYVRAYATNSAGTTYGNQVNFRTASSVIISTETPTTITMYSAICGGNISTDNGFSITARGVCWSVYENPTINNNKTIDGAGTGTFISKITGLESNNMYFVRAYATNSTGISYGNQVSFKTYPPAVLTTETPSTITMNSAVCSGNISNYYGEEMTARGFCWSMTETPTINDNKTIDGVGIGFFSGRITGLIRNTTYFVRAYAIFSSVISYGNIQSFTTTKWDGGTVTDIDGNVYHTVTIGTQVWLVENLKTTRYRNGDLIGTTSADITNEENPKYQWPCNFDENNVSTYGRYYTWYAVDDKRNICPEGWHVPSNDEWIILYNYIKDKYGFQQGTNMANVMSSTSYWLLHCDNVTNSTGFTALPGGWDHGWFGLLGFWWSSTARTNNTAFFSDMYTCDFSPSCYTIFPNSYFGVCVRCVLN